MGMNDTQYFTYDACGNPEDYINNTSLAWTRGRLLNSYTKSGVTSTFIYNAQGIRTSKKVGTTTTTYTLEGNRILSDGTLTYIYNHSGLVGFKYGSETFYYLKNIFGDIAAIYNSNNDEVAKYTYDAWGNCTVQSIVGMIGYINPFRYRGYYWDKDLQLYYCRSRYYDPQVGRWISPDTLEYLEPSQLNGLNLYAYCGNDQVNSRNNPVNYGSKLTMTLDNNSGYYVFPSLHLNMAMKRIKGLELFNTVIKNHHTTQLINDPLASLLFGNISVTFSVADKSPGLFYSYISAGIDSIKTGGGINLFGWLGISGYASQGNNWYDSSVGFDLQITPLINVGGSIGWDGIGASLGFSYKDTTVDFGIKIGWGTIAFALAAVIVAPYLSPVIAVLGLLFGI